MLTAIPLSLREDSINNNTLAIPLSRKPLLLVLTPKRHFPLRLMDPHNPQEVVFQREKVKQDAVPAPRHTADHCARYGVEDEVVGRRDNGDENDGRVGDAEGDAEQTTRRGDAQT